MANAFDKTNVKSVLGWSNAFNPDGAFPLDLSCWFGSLEEAQAAAATAVEFGSSASKYHFGKQLYVFDGTECKTYLIQGDKTLKEIGANDAPMLFVDDENGMLALTDIKSGQQVYRSDTHTTWIFKGGEASTLSNWVENASQNDTKWEGTSDKVLFFSTTQDTYDKLERKDESTLYFTADTKRIYKGNSDVTSSVYASDSIPAVGAAVKGKLYIDTTTFECKITLDGKTWIVTSPGYLTDGAEWASADSGKLATIGLIKKGIKAAIDAAKTGLVHDVTYDASTLTLTIPVNGKEDVVVNIPKDKFVTAGKYYENYPEENPTHHKVIVLTIDNQDEPVIIPAEALVNIYVPENDGKDVTVAISDDYKISATVKLDPDANNAITSSTSGIKVDISGKLDKLTGADIASKVVIAKEDGTIETSTADINTSNEDLRTDADTSSIPTVGGVIATVNAIKTEVNDTNIAKIADGKENNIVAVATNGTVKDSGKSVGLSELAAAPNANTLATEAAVKKAVDGVVLTWGSIS